MTGDDRAGEVQEVVGVVVVRVVGERVGVREVGGVEAEPLGLDHAGGDDADVAVELVDRERVDGVAKPVEVGRDRGAGADRQGEGEAVLVRLLERAHAQLHHGLGDQVGVRQVGRVRELKQHTVFVRMRGWRAVW